MTDQLYHHIQKLVPGFTTEQEKIAPFFQTKTVKKEELLLTEREICDTIYFVNKGCLYLFYEDNEDKQVIHFALENWWITDYKTFPDGNPAVYSIAAMEDSEITCMSRENYETLLLQFPLLALYFNKIHERAYGAALYKQKTFATVSKNDFYRYFRSTYPELIQRIPAPIFASYMGVSLRTLRGFQHAYIS
ncbi:cyclic nucleotide-binding domain-containing protein [Mucilaginibacter sabulilitoris]|uniref:Cyclic nucleotide-binding domain-containing protein n=1 Tax=Mucilaginibacter sabulilitoris TaxID=1173583 RepID=A0ABZ0TVF8_9SPHI|nr:cyclic nucleotide-binding domain-containing protein [Mucilaginibacter sabulilitoris]WPU96128.1 cyclic nucleotide-binding domain-containing protein [Mucilaginibacter sabulilitoris]